MSAINFQSVHCLQCKRAKIRSQKELSLRLGCKALAKLFNLSDTQLLCQCHIQYWANLIVIGLWLFALLLKKCSQIPPTPLSFLYLNIGQQLIVLHMVTETYEHKFSSFSMVDLFILTSSITMHKPMVLELSSTLTFFDFQPESKCLYNISIHLISVANICVQLDLLIFFRL